MTRSTSAWCASAFALCLALVALEWPLLARRAAPLWDALDLHAPMQMLLADHARAGRWLLWDPWTMAGTPAYADPQIGSFSPVSLAFGLATGGSTRGFAILWLAHWALGALGVLALARRLGAPAWGGLVVGLGWLFSPLYVGQAQHLPILISLSWLPFVLVRLDVALREQRLRPALEAGALWGLSALYGYPATTLLNAGFALAFAWARVPRGAPRRPLPRAAAAGAFLLVGAAVLAPAYAGILYEARGYSDYTGPKTREAAVASNALAPGALATFASPHLATLKLLAPRRLWPGTDVTMASVYTGAAPVVLALFALAGGLRDRLRIALGAFACLTLAFAVGDALPLRGWLYDLVPPTRYFRHAALFRHYAIVCVAALAALGSADLARTLDSHDRAARRRLLGAAVLAGLAALVAYAAVERGAGARGASHGAARALLLASWGGLVALAAADRAGRVPRSALLVPAALVALALVDAAATSRLSRTISASDTGTVLRWNQLDRLRSQRLDLTPSGLARSETASVTGDPSGINVALKLATLEGYFALSNRFHVALVEEPVLAAAALETSGARPRTWFAPVAAEVPLDDASFAALAARARALGAPPLVVHPPEAMLALGAAHESAAPPAPPAAIDWPAATPVPVTVHRYEPGRLELGFVAPADGWLLVTDRWSRSWRARIDGAPAPVWGGNFVFRALHVTKGPRRIEYSFEPPALRALVAVSWATLAAVAASAVAGAVRERASARHGAVGGAGQRGPG